MRLLPFRGLRYDTAVAGPAKETSAPAYGSFDPFRYTFHRTTNPYTVMELITADGRGGPTSFTSAGAHLERWRRTEILVEDEQPVLYLYEQHELRAGVPRVQRGIVGALDLHDLDDGHLLLHEHIEPDRAEARQVRLRTVPVDLTPVTALHVGWPDGSDDALAQITARAAAIPPLAAFTDDDLVDHRLWRISDPDAIDALVQLYAPVVAVLADGHHRVAAADRARPQGDELSDRTDRPVDGNSWSATLVWLVEAERSGPELRALHRRVPGVPTRADGIPVLAGFEVSPFHGASADLAAHIAAQQPSTGLGLILPEDRWLVRRSDGGGRPSGSRERTPEGAGWPEADVVIADRDLAPLISDGVPEPVVDIEEAVIGLRQGRRASVIVVPPSTPATILAMARAGQRMPAKATWFRPKPRAGLVMRAIDGP